MYDDILKTSKGDLIEYITEELKKIIEDKNTEAHEKLDAIRQLAEVHNLYENN